MLLARRFETRELALPRAPVLPESIDIGRLRFGCLFKRSVVVELVVGQSALTALVDLYTEPRISPVPIARQSTQRLNNALGEVVANQGFEPRTNGL